MKSSCSCWAFLAGVCVLMDPVWAEVFLTVPQTVELFKGDTAEISCQFTFIEAEPTSVNISLFAESPDHTKTLIYSTHQDEEFVVPNSEYTDRIEVISDGLHEVRLFIKDVQFSDDRVFIFRIDGGRAGRAERRTSLRVFDPTTMVMSKVSPLGLVKEGDTVVLRCRGGGNPQLPVTFTRGEEQNVVLQSSGDSLILSSVSRRDSGIYRCRPLLTNSITEVKGEMELTVHYLDPVVLEAEAQVVFEGEDVTVTCNAPSSLVTVTVWYKGGKQVRQGNTLHLQDATYEDSGEYACEVFAPALPFLRTYAFVDIAVQASTSMASFTVGHGMLILTVLMFLGILAIILYSLYKEGKFPPKCCGKDTAAEDEIYVEMKPLRGRVIESETVHEEDEDVNEMEPVYEDVNVLETVGEDAGMLETVDEESVYDNVSVLETVGEDASMLETVDEDVSVLETVDEDAGVLETVDEDAGALETVDEDAGALETVDEEFVDIHGPTDL